MGLQVPLLVHRQVSAHALPNLPEGHTAHTHTHTHGHPEHRPDRTDRPRPHGYASSCLAGSRRRNLLRVLRCLCSDV